jgi:hypothetical protein
MPFSTALKSLVDEAWQSKSFGDIASAPLGALGGLTQQQGKRIMDALEVKSIAEFAQCRYVLWAQAIAHLAKFERVDAFNPSLAVVLDEKWEKKNLRTIAKASPAVFAGLSEKDAAILFETLGVRSVEDFAAHRVVMAAQVIAHLARHEKADEIRKAA